jgi:purine-nucleoside phosphorylase
MSIPTPHNSAKKGDIAKKVLMPGDPLRAKYIAETYLENPVCFNTVRNMFGYTGTYKGEQISVMGSGMGMPSMGIYSYELYNFYDVEKIIRIGSAGALQDDVSVMDGCCDRHECMYGFKLCKPVSAAGDFCSYSKL